MIDPNAVSTIRVGELSPEPFSLTDNIPHEVGTDLKRGSIEDLATFISAFIGSTDGVGFRAISVTDGQTLPTTTQQEFILVGKGTYYNVVGGSTIICTEELNAIVSNGSYWFIGVEIPVNVELAGITQFIRDGFINTTPSEDAVYDALALKANVADSELKANKQNDLTSDGTGTKYPTVDAVNAIDLNKVINVSGEAGLTSGDNNLDVEITPTKGSFQSYNSVKSTSIGVKLGELDIQATDVFNNFKTKIGINTPLNSFTTINFPSPIIDGTYTLATTDEISALDSNVVHKTGDETITGSKTFRTDTEDPSITILNSSTTAHPAQRIINAGAGNGLEIEFTTGTGKALITKDNGVEKFSVSKNGYFNSQGGFINGILDFTNTNDVGIGQFYMNLNRFLFTNTSGNLQFLTQNNGFSTYKTNSISGTFSNIGLTANRTFTLPDVSGTLAVVSQTITNGVTDKSPSEDAVFDALASKVSGSGTTNYIPKFTGTSSLGNSLIYDNGTGIGVNTTPTTTLDVKTIGLGSVRIGGSNGSTISAFNTAGTATISTISTGIDTPTLYTNLLVNIGGNQNQIGITSTSLSFKTTNIERARINNNGSLLINTIIDDGIATNKLQVDGNIKATQFRISALNTAPASATDTGTLGEVRITSGYIYVCISTNTWVRTELKIW